MFESRKWALPRQFDCNFFCRAIDIMIGCDHHQVVQKALRMLYSFSDVFVSEARRALFIDLVLHKHFYSLFLHWDPAIRNSFQQLLVFKVPRHQKCEMKHHRPTLTALLDAWYSSAPRTYGAAR